MASAASPPTSRVLDVLELLARRGLEPPRLSDLVRDLDLTQATAHAIMATLCDRGWAVRNPTTKTYTLGPAIGTVAARATAAVPYAQAARAVARQLAHDLGYPASVTERVGDVLVIAALELGGCQSADVSAGERLPFAAPFGATFAAWESEEGRRAWVERGAVTNAEFAERLDRHLAATRERGYGVERVGPTLAQAARLITTAQGDTLTAPVRRVIDELVGEITSRGFLADDQGRSGQRVTAVTAPVFDRFARVVLCVSVHPLRVLSPERTEDLGGRLARVTATIDGTAGSAVIQ